MDKATTTTVELMHKLTDLGENGLAIRVGFCHLKTLYLAERGKQIRKRQRKFNLAAKRHAAAIDQLSSDIPKIILSHQE